MQFTQYLIEDTQAWAATQGNYTFLILKSRETGFVCSYKIHSIPSRLATFFKGNEEFQPSGLYENAPKNFDVASLKEAQDSCKRKYKEILLR